MGVERYRVNLSAVFEVEDPERLLAAARKTFGSAAPHADIDMFLPDAAAALEHVLDPSALTTGVPGLALVRGTVGAELLRPEDE